MKKLFFLSIISSILLFFSCKEIGPNVNLNNSTNTGDGVQERNVLIEEFTGVQCVNCPEGSAKIEELLGIHGDNLIAISIHSGFFSTPYPQSAYDFRTSEGTSIENMLGPAIGYPAATINRKLFESEGGMILNKDKWAGYIATEKLNSPLMNVDIDKNYNATTRLLDVTANLTFNETVTTPVYLSVMITENNITDTQLTPDGLVEDYSHKHVLRGLLTNFDGDAYTGSTTVSASGSQTYTMTIPSSWNINNCHIIVAAHQFGSNKEVYQANETSIID